MTPTQWQAAAGLIAAYAALFAGIYAVVTVPLLRTIKSAVEASEARLKAMITEVKLQMTETEGRLNQRISDKLNEHGDRITRLEERRFK